jgi:hypothetical protein
MPTIFVIEIDGSDGPGGAVVDGRLTRIVRDRDHQNLTPGEFHTTLSMGSPISDCPAWCDVDVEVHTGERFLIFSDKKTGVADMVSEPSYFQLLGPDDDPIGDAELMVSVDDEPLDRQAQAMSAGLEASRGPHGGLLAQYVAALLVVYGPEFDTWRLEKVVEGTAFSAVGKLGLLSGLVLQMRGSAAGRTKDYVRSALVNLVPRYLLEDAGKPGDDGLTEMQQRILLNYDLFQLDGVAAALKADLKDTMRQQLRAKMLGIANDPHVGVNGRGAAVRFLGLLDQPR